jgi:hypothetical protein
MTPRFRAPDARGAAAPPDVRSPAPSAEPGVRRLNANVPATLLDEMVEEKRRSGRDITELVKLGWQLVKIALREQRQGRALAVVDADGRIVKELVIPD